MAARSLLLEQLLKNIEREKMAMNAAEPKLLNPKFEADRLEIASQLYERFCADLLFLQSDAARVRLIAGIQVALRDAAAGESTVAPSPVPVIKVK